MRHPLARAVRADKTTLAGVAETLRHYARGEAVDAIPVWQMIAIPMSELRNRAEAIVKAIPSRSDDWEVMDSIATVGGGSLPGATLPSVALVHARARGESLERLACDLRTGDPAVYPRIEDDRLLLDLRTIQASDDDRLVQALSRMDRL
jgi:L-seryl-tRNA(Ser) seleniumtransferase